MEIISKYIKYSDKLDLKPLQAVAKMELDDMKLCLETEKLTKIVNTEVKEIKEILMSAEQFKKGGKDIKGIPITITPDGLPPKSFDEKGQESEKIEVKPIDIKK